MVVSERIVPYGQTKKAESLITSIVYCGFLLFAKEFRTLGIIFGSY